MDRHEPHGDPPVLAHHRAAAAVWDKGGAAYDEISFGLSDALKHAVQRLDPRPGDLVLDVGTGTGWTARSAARMGARVTAVDIGAELVAAGKALSAHLRPRIAFEVADAENLPFPDASFDGVISTFGVIFAQKQLRAAGELGRVCRKGGRLALAVCWGAISISSSRPESTTPTTTVPTRSGRATPKASARSARSPKGSIPSSARP